MNGGLHLEMPNDFANSGVEIEMSSMYRHRTSDSLH